MVIPRICAMLESDSPSFPPTLLYNEGWLLRLVIDWFSIHNLPDHPLSFPPDAALGHFEVGKERKTDLSLLPDAEHLVILEAKMFSGLTPGITHAAYYDQAARTVACVAEVLRRADRHPSNFSQLGFTVLAPQSQIDAGKFDGELERDSIRHKVEWRVADYGGVKDAWYSDWFEPTLERIEIGVLGWEELIETMRPQSAAHSAAPNCTAVLRTSAGAIQESCQHCLCYNQPVGKASASPSSPRFLGGEERGGGS